MEEDGFINYTAKFEDLGTHYIFVEVNDNKGNKSYSYLEIEVVSDNVPVIEKIHTQYVKKDELFVYDVIAFDADNDVLFYTIEGLPDTAINPLTGRISYLVSSDESMLPVNVTVVDINGNHVMESFYIEVEI
jgi:imidazole glycerol phosphate synthase subunit HisF